MYHQPWTTQGPVGHRNVPWCRVLMRAVPTLRVRQFSTCVDFTPEASLFSSSPPPPFPPPPSILSSTPVTGSPPQHPDSWAENRIHLAFPEEQSYQMFTVYYSNSTSEKESGRILGKSKNALINHGLTSCQRASTLRLGTTFLHAGSRSIVPRHLA